MTKGSLHFFILACRVRFMDLIYRVFQTSTLALRRIHIFEEPLIKDNFGRLSNVIRVNHDRRVVLNDLLSPIEAPNFGAESPRPMRFGLSI
jgi:hypothetical protein